MRISSCEKVRNLNKLLKNMNMNCIYLKPNAVEYISFLDLFWREYKEKNSKWNTTLSKYITENGHFYNEMFSNNINYDETVEYVLDLPFLKKDLEEFKEKYKLSYDNELYKNIIDPDYQPFDEKFLDLYSIEDLEKYSVF